MQNNFDRFQANRAIVQRNVVDFLQDEHSIAKIDVQEVSQFDRDGFTVDDITKAIENIDVLRDQNLRITRYRAHDMEGNIHIIRDARNAAPYPNESVESATMIMLATSRAALFMIEQNLKSDPTNADFKKAKERLCKITNMWLENRDTKLSKVSKAHDFNQHVLTILKDTPLKDNKHLKKELQNTSHMMNFHNTAQHLTTLSTVSDKNGNPHVGIESEVMLLGFTAQQLEMFRSIRRGTYDMTPDHMKSQHYPWYDKLSAYEKALVRDALHHAMDSQGNMIHPFPTQVREILPGLRNAYYKETATQNVKGAYVQVAELFHSGSLYLKMKTQDAQNCVNEMAAQLGTFMSKNAGKQYIDVVLNSPANFFNMEESRVAEMVGNAMTAIGNFFSITPLNFFRLFSGSDFTGYEHFLSEFGNAFYNMYPSSQGQSYALYYMQHDGSSSKALEEIQNLRKWPNLNSEALGILDTLENCVKARELMNSYAFIFDSQNRNLQLAKIFADLNFSINNENGAINQHFTRNGKADLLNPIPQLNMHCMSGIDRLGVTANRCSNNALNHYYGVEEGTKEYAQNNQNIINAGHTQAMPSLNNSGAHGVKKDSKWAIPENDYKEVEHITTNSAGNNKLKYNEKAVLDLAALDRETLPIKRDQPKDKELTQFASKELERREARSNTREI